MTLKITMSGDPLPASRSFAITTASAESHWHIPEEVPVAFVYNRRNYAVMMATPKDIVDFAIGFTLTEQIVKTPTDVKEIDIRMSDQGVDCRIKISNDDLVRLDTVQRRRNMVGSASCGLCGLENADTLFQKLTPVADQPVALPDAAMVKAINELAAHQPLNEKTRSNHAAGWADMNGVIKFVREDVGRHNALDKLVGALARDQISPKDGFVVMSSRCSYEIVEKAARCGVLAIVSISGPTAFALRKAKEAHIALFAKSGDGVARLL